jgi:hypothetical protein
LYRYSLWRIWDDLQPHVLFVCLNPSTADAMNDDRTVGRCKRYARDWGFGGLVIVNLFAFRAREPEDMKAAADPVGPDTDAHILREASGSGIVVFGWGADGGWRDRDKEVAQLLANYAPTCLTLTQAGHPGHPLYLKADLLPQPFEIPTAADYCTTCDDVGYYYEGGMSMNEEMNVRMPCPDCDAAGYDELDENEKR